MQCTKTGCEKKAVIHRKYEGSSLCKMHFCQNIEHTFRKTVSKYKLIDEGDHIVSGFSGGKDSAVLLYLLAGIAEKKKIKLSAVLVNEGISNYRDVNIHKAEKFCNDRNIELKIVDVKKKTGKTIDDVAEGQKELRPCSYCGVFRRTLLNETARQLGATKLAIGHNLDDEVQSIMANHIKGDLARGSRLGPKTPESDSKKFIPRIKPLIDIPEKEVGLYAFLKGLIGEFDECPYAQHSFRWFIRDMINDMEVKYPGSKFSIRRAFERMQPALLETQKKEKKELKYCMECEEPCSGEICRACELTQKMVDFSIS